MRALITSLSEIRTAKRCPLKWWFGSSNHQRLSPKIMGLPFDLGTCVHAALAYWTTNPDALTAEVTKQYMVVAATIAAEAESVYEREVGVRPNDIERKAMHENTALGIQMVVNYMEFWKRPLEKGHTLVETSEQEFLIDIPGTPHKLKGFLDHVIMNDDGLLLALDRKTYEKRPKKEALLSDEQFVGYTWALGMIHGFDKVIGVAYDGLWKRFEPNPKYKQTWSDLFLRLAIKPTLDQIQNFQDELVHVVNWMASFEPTPELEHDARFYKFRTNNCLWDCKDFIRLCDTIRHDEDLPLVVQKLYRQRTLDDDRIALRKKYSESDDSE